MLLAHIGVGKLRSKTVLSNVEHYLCFSVVCVCPGQAGTWIPSIWNFVNLHFSFPAWFPPFLPSLLPPHFLPPSFPLTCTDFIFLFFYGNIETIETCFSPSLGAGPFHLWFSQFPSKLNIKQICLLTADPKLGTHGPPPGVGELSRQRWRRDRMEPVPIPWGSPKVVSLPSRQPNSQ